MADGNFYSGDELGATLGVGRSAVWRHIQTLRRYGLDIYAVSGRGYRLREPLELLSESLIGEALPAAARPLIAAIEIHQTLGSTNGHLMRPEALELLNGSLCFAEYQHAGRGRRGRRWISPFGSNLCFSMVWHFNCGPDALSGLSLAVAVGVAQGVASLGFSQPGLKWPNDLSVDGRKLAGILLEMSGESSGMSRVVVGVGLNLRMLSEAPSEMMASIDQPWIALDELLQPPVSRNRAAAVLAGAVANALAKYEKQGLQPFLPLWQQWDVIANKRVTLQQASGARGTIEGWARGVDVLGALLIEHRGEVCRYLSGDVTLLRTVQS